MWWIAGILQILQSKASYSFEFLDVVDCGDIADSAESGTPQIHWKVAYRRFSGKLHTPFAFSLLYPRNAPNRETRIPRNLVVQIQSGILQIQWKVVSATPFAFSLLYPRIPPNRETRIPRCVVVQIQSGILQIQWKVVFPTPLAFSLTSAFDCPQWHTPLAFSTCFEKAVEQRAPKQYFIRPNNTACAQTRLFSFRQE